MNELRNPVIMVIDEMPDRMKTFLEMIKNQPLKLETIYELSKAKRQLKFKSPDLIVMDLSSKFAEKKAICEAVMNQKHFRTKFLFIVPTSFPELIFMPQEYLVGHITKPFYIGDVLGKVHSALYDKYVKQMAT